MQFVSGAGAGQTAVVVQYIQGTRIATITRVAVAADTTTTYAIAPAVVSKFTASWTTGEMCQAQNIVLFRL